MCTAVAGPALLGLPFAMSLLGWPAGILVLVLGYVVTLYNSYLIAKLHETGGKFLSAEPNDCQSQAMHSILSQTIVAGIQRHTFSLVSICIASFIAFVIC